MVIATALATASATSATSTASAPSTAWAASAKQAKQQTPKPDLKITTFRPELGTPAHGLADTRGVLETVSIGVVIENLGHATAGASTVEVWLEDSVGRRFVKKQRVPALTPRHKWAKVVQISGAKPALGFAKLGGLADAFDKVDESDEHNAGATENYKLFITCLGTGPHTEDHQFLTLDTYEGTNREPTMSPSASHLSDTTSDSTLFTTWKWDFQATGF
jgi:hypothetical protein